MNLEQQQCILGALGYYRLRRRDGTLAIDGLKGPATEGAIRRARKDLGLPDSADWDTETERLLCGRLTAVRPQEPPRDFARYFARQEMACRCGRCGGFPNEPDPALGRVLDQIREHFGRPVRITSGLRCRAHNAAVGGVSNSQHLYGRAADLVIPGVDPGAVARYASLLLGDSGGVGSYPGFTHVDVRARKARWRG